MPDLEPVSGDPFAPQLTPVSGDPFGADVDKKIEGFAQRIEEYGHNPERIDDRRGDRPSGYQAMMAGNQRIRMITRLLLGMEPQGGEKGADYILPPPEGPLGQLEKDAGLYDIGKHLGRHYYELAPQDNTAPSSWGYDPDRQRVRLVPVQHDPFAKQ